MKPVIPLLTFIAVAAAGVRCDADEAFTDAAGPFLQNYCVRCHGPEKVKGKVRVDGLNERVMDNPTLWQAVKEMVQFEDMPPEDEKQPIAGERRRFLDWINTKLLAVEAAVTDHEALYDPTRGNAVDHEKLFDGSVKGPAYSPPRFWRRSQYQYDAMMEHLWVLPKLRYHEALERTSPEHAKYGYSQPFPQMDPAHFTNYSGGVHGDDAVLRALMDAGSQMAIRLTSDDTRYNPDIQPLNRLRVNIRKLPGDSPLRDFVLTPPARPAEFEPFLKEKARPTGAEREAAVRRVFSILLDREPTGKDLERFGGLLSTMVDKRGALIGLRGLITAVFVSPEFVYRTEIGMGPTDAYGRRMLSPNELVYAIAYALTDDGPDQKLWEAARSGKLSTRADVEREVRRVLADDSIEKHRRLRFFQEFFGYTGATEVFKDARGWGEWAKILVRDADQLVEYVLRKDKNVLAELLTTDRYFVAYPAFDDPALLDELIKTDLEKLDESQQEMRAGGKDPKELPGGPYEYRKGWSYANGLTPIPSNDSGPSDENYIVIYGYDYRTFGWTRDQPIKTPNPRAGMLTHPAWLVAHSHNFDNYAIGRGRWIRENLLAGKIPDVPIDVDAQLPDEDATLRQRMRVTREDYCWRCHKKMNPLGLPFEMYDHYGQWRKEELVGEKRKDLHLTFQLREKYGVPYDTSGEIIESGEASLNGKVTDAIDLAHKLANSERVRQSFVRHAFRYWMGRNEMLSDSPTLIAADKAYVDGGGSFNELLVSLLTSDSFLYRK